MKHKFITGDLVRSINNGYAKEGQSFGRGLEMTVTKSDSVDSKYFEGKHKNGRKKYELPISKFELVTRRVDTYPIF